MLYPAKAIPVLAPFTSISATPTYQKALPLVVGMILARG